MTTRRKALEALSSDQKKRLVALSRFLARDTGDDGEDLLQTAHLRWLKATSSGDLTPAGVQKFLLGAMYSVRSNRFRQLRTQKRQIGGRLVAVNADAEEPVECVADPSQSTEDAVFAQQVYDLCAPDSELQSYVMYRLERTPRADIQEDSGWDHNKYEAVQKRFNRMVAKWKIERKLP